MFENLRLCKKYCMCIAERTVMIVRTKTGDKKPAENIGRKSHLIVGKTVLILLRNITCTLRTVACLFVCYKYLIIV